jgi:hypothetical protein
MIDIILVALIVAFVVGIGILWGIYQLSKESTKEFTEEMQREEEKRWLSKKKDAGYSLVELIVSIFGIGVMLFIFSCSAYVVYLIILALQKYIGG